MFKNYSKNNAFADMGLFYSAAIWGSTFFVVKDALTDVHPVLLVAYRFLIAGALTLFFIISTKRSLWGHLREGVILSVIIWLLYVSQTLGLKYTTASNSGFITGLFVAFIPLFLILLFKKKPKLMEVIAALVSLTGLWILTGGMRDINPGDMITMVAAVTYALHVLFADKFAKRGIDPYVICCQQFIIVGILSFITAIIFKLPLTVTSSSAGWTILFLALFPTLSAFVIQMLAQKITPPMKVSLIYAFEPVFAGIFAWTLGGENMVSHRALGGFFIFLALIISGLPSSLKKPNKLKKI